MVKRLLDTTATELATYSRLDVLAAIRASEGRILASEMYDVSNRCG